MPIAVKPSHRQPDAPRRVVFDDFIHVVDTLLFLAPGAVRRRRSPQRGIARCEPPVEADAQQRVLRLRQGDQTLHLRVVFDDFIHVVDTLLFLAPGAVRRRVIEPRVVDGRFR
jgi:hypothetical protein